MFPSTVTAQYKIPASVSSLHVGLLWIAKMLISLPLFLLPRRGRPVRVKALHEMHPMAYLDGLRGYNSLTILTCHVMARAWKWIPDEIVAIPWLQWPVRQGHASLLMFFWISGYVSTYKIVGLMQTGQSEQLLDNLTSTTFRRYPRLMLPMIPVMFVTTMLVSAGIATMPSDIASDKPNANVISNPFWYWVNDVGRFANPFTKIVGYSDGGTGSKLLAHTWSLPAEFRSTMILCVLCTATHKFSTKNRKILIWLAVPAFLYWASPWAAMAWIGMWFAECRQERRRENPDKLRSPIPTTSPQWGVTSSSEKSATVGKQETPQLANQNFDRYRRWALVVLFLYSFVYIQNPHDMEHKKTFPHVLVNRLIPQHWPAVIKMHVHLVIGCTMLTYPLDQLQVLQRPLLTQFSQFLGELSFGIYATHITVRWVLWEPVLLRISNKQCGARAMDYFWCAFPELVCLTICVIWAAEAFRRLDMQVVRLCKALEAKLFEK